MEGHLIESWDEGIDHAVDFELTLPAALQEFHFRFPGCSETQLLRDGIRQLVGIVSRTQHDVTGTVSVSSENIRDGLLKVAVDIANTTAIEHDPHDRNFALLGSLLSAHTILSVSGGQFISLLDPPEDLRDAVSACTNVGNFPVLVGDPPERDMLLCSPIVLYDYPQIAPESATDFYDATEMDEMLTLRVMTLTDDEKNEMRLADDHVRNLLERTEQSAREQLMKTHGTIRGLRPVSGDKS